jgi:hypothetical protein
MRIDLYTICWNEVRFLPFFFRHYDPVVSRYVVFDDGSTDGSQSLLMDHPRVELRSFRRTNPDSFVESERGFFENCWKESRGRADWVILVNIDELLYHRELRTYLGECRAFRIAATQFTSGSFSAPCERRQRGTCFR